MSIKANPVIAVILVGAAAAASAAPPAGSNAPDPNSPAQKRARAEAALARVATIMPKLAKLRELDFLHDVPREYPTADQVKALVHADVAGSMSAAESAALSDALLHLGLLQQPADLEQLEEQTILTQAGAFYTPKTKRFYLVAVPDNDTLLDTMSSHELTHGLQDQHFDLTKYVPDDPRTIGIDDDANTARHFVVEGDATLAMTLYMVAQVAPGGVVPNGAVDALATQLAFIAKMSPADIAKMSSPLADSTDPDIKKSIDAMATIPETILVPMVDSYMQGALLCVAAYKRGGWKAVDDLYAHPPQSTEQALHPDKYFAGDRPVKVTLPKLAGKELANMVLGELQWQVYFDLWAPDRKTAASEGWGGDRESVVKRANGRYVTRIATSWDTPADAAEFAAAYTASLAKRYPKGSGDPAAKAGFDRGDGQGKVFLKSDGKRVLAVDGADTAKDLAALAAGAGFH